jgi:hypothetical protein
MFRRPVAEVEASNGIIYVEDGLCTGHLRACLPIWMSSNGGNRFLRTVVDRRQFDSDSQLIGAIGHELQHVIEVLSDGFVTDSTKMYFYYRRYAPTERRDRFETQKAINPGIIVGREFRAWREESASGDGQDMTGRFTARLLSTSGATAN